MNLLCILAKALVSACSFLVILCEVGFEDLMRGKKTVCDVGSL